MKEITTINNVLVVNGTKIHFKYEIKECVEIGDNIIVRLIVAGHDDDINNIYCVRDGKIVWRVQDILEYDPGYAIFGPDVYTMIRVYSKDPRLIIANTGEGYRFLIDPENGKIVGRESWVK